MRSSSSPAFAASFTRLYGCGSRWRNSASPRPWSRLCSRSLWPGWDRILGRRTLHSPLDRSAAVRAIPPVCLVELLIGALRYPCAAYDKCRRTHIGKRWKRFSLELFHLLFRFGRMDHARAVALVHVHGRYVSLRHGRDSQAFRGESGHSFSYLYLANVMGAVLGTLVPAFFLIELFGFEGRSTSPSR